MHQNYSASTIRAMCGVKVVFFISKFGYYLTELIIIEIDDCIKYTHLHNN